MELLEKRQYIPNMASILLVSAFFRNLRIPWVYFLLSLEEAVRLMISLVVFRRKTWMNQLESAE